MAESATDNAVANIAALRRGYEAFQNGNLDLLRDELFDPDIVWHSPGPQHAGGRLPRCGRRDRELRQAEETGGTFKVEVHDILGSDDHAVALATASAQRNGKSINEPYAHVCHFRDGKLTEAWILDFDPYKVDEFFA